MPTFEEFHVKLNLNNYFWFEDVHYSKKYNLYYLDVTSKATGEIIQIPLTEEQFDILLEEMETNVKFLEEEWQFMREGKWWFL